MCVYVIAAKTGSSEAAPSLAPRHTHTHQRSFFALAAVTHSLSGRVFSSSGADKDTPSEGRRGEDTKKVDDEEVNDEEVDEDEGEGEEEDEVETVAGTHSRVSS